MALRFLAASVVQGSADAFAETEFQTGLSNVTRQAYRIRRIEWYVPAPIGADSNIAMCLRRNSSASLSTLVGNPMIAGFDQTMELTTSGMVLIPKMGPMLVNTYAKDEELLVVEESLFLQIDSTGTSASNTGFIRVGYETRAITENERLSIQALTAGG